MYYDFSKMDSNSFEEMVRSLNKGIFGIKLENEDFEGCQQIRNRIMNDMMKARSRAVTR